MKNSMKKLMAVIAVVLCIACVLAGCGNRKPTKEDAMDYVQAVLDGICTGDYDHSVKFVDMEESDLTNMREEVLDAFMDGLMGSGELTLSEETAKSFRDVMDKALTKCKYQVVDAVEKENGYDVTVSIEPLKVMDSENLQHELTNYLLTVPNILSMSEDEIMEVAMKYIAEQIDAGLDSPAYDDAVQVTVSYTELEKGQYGVSKEDGERLGEKMFSVNAD